MRCDWKSDEVGKWEEEHKDFRTNGDGVRHDMYLVDLASSKATKQPPIERKNESALTKNLVHGRSISPDGKRCAFEDRAYQLYLADADGSNARRIDTGLRFHLIPTWSPDGAWARLLDVYDFHDGSSDLPVWAPDSRSVFYTSKVGRNVELFRVPLDGKPEQLTDAPAGAMHYHPNPSPGGKWLVYGSKRDGVRQLYVMRLSDNREWPSRTSRRGTPRCGLTASPDPRANARADDNVFTRSRAQTKICLELGDLRNHSSAEIVQFLDHVLVVGIGCTQFDALTV